MKTEQMIFKDGEWTPPISSSSALDSERTVIFTFFPSDMKMESVIQDLKKNFPRSHLVGCSGSGEIAKTKNHDDRIIVSIAYFESTEVKSFSHTLTDPSACYAVGQRIAVDAAGKDLRAIYILSKGLNINGTELMNGIRSQVQNEVIVAGGLAGDGTRFASTKVLHNETLSENLITAVSFYGSSFQISSHAIGGWLPFGPERQVTKSTGNLLFELDGKPALGLYKEFLGESAKKLPASALHFPLLLGTSGKNTRNIVRTILGIDEENQSMIFAGDIPQGEFVRFMRSTEKNLIDAAALCADHCKADLNPNEPTMSVVVSCVGRRIVLGTSTEEEIYEVFSRLPPHSIQTGFYSYGELAPGDTGFCDLHNQTITLTWFQEKKVA